MHPILLNTLIDFIKKSNIDSMDQTKNKDDFYRQCLNMSKGETHKRFFIEFPFLVCLNSMLDLRI